MFIWPAIFFCTYLVLSHRHPMGTNTAWLHWHSININWVKLSCIGQLYKSGPLGQNLHWQTRKCESHNLIFTIQLDFQFRDHFTRLAKILSWSIQYLSLFFSTICIKPRYWDESSSVLSVICPLSHLRHQCPSSHVELVQEGFSGDFPFLYCVSFEQGFSPLPVSILGPVGLILLPQDCRGHRARPRGKPRGMELHLSLGRDGTFLLDSSNTPHLLKFLSSLWILACQGTDCGRERGSCVLTDAISPLFVYSSVSSFYL